MTSNLTTLLDWARYATSELTQAQREKRIAFGHGTSTALDEAIWMVTGALRLDPDRFEMFAQAHLSASEIERLHILLRQRIETSRPLAYLLGEAWLMGQRFLCDDRALVPRSFLAELLDEALDPFLRTEPTQILDMCTGGGSLAILSALRFEEAKVSAADISRDALDLARSNVELFDLGKRIKLIQTDLFASVKGKFDLILCNPPYVNAGTMNSLPAEFRQEPQIALHGGLHGMDLITRIFEQVGKHLTKHGILVLELGHEAAHFERLLGHFPVTWLPCSGPDQAVFVISSQELAAA